jgi:FMN-dependent NADH-azoreductase
MSKVLVLNSSVLGDASASKVLVQQALARLRDEHPSLSVIERDIGASPIPHLTGASVAAIKGGSAANDAQRAALALSDELIAELKAADIIVMGAPMYNFGIPSSLKAWFDYVLRAGVTFRYTEAGAEGLLPGKRAIVIETRGGLYSEGPAQAMDSQEPHLRTMLGLMGITDVTFVRAEKLAFGPEVREQAMRGAEAELARFAREHLQAAA